MKEIERKMFKLKYLICFFMPTVIAVANGEFLGIGNILTSINDIGHGVISDIGNKLPTPKGVFEAGKQVLAGYPFEVVSSVVNTVCSSALSSQTISPKITPDMHKINFQFRTPCENHIYPLLEADKMWKSPQFDSSKQVVIFVTGWLANATDSTAIDTMAKAYHCRGDANFIALDTAGFIETLYTWSAFNTEIIGVNLAKSLKDMSESVAIKNIHLIGHSLGAHIVGVAGRAFSEMTGKLIPRITGLDPSKPCFNEGENLSGLLRGDADFIDVIHSNPGVLGKRDPVGDVDFYPGGLDPLPPGCISIACAHERAWAYYAETVYPGNEENFIGKRCSSLTKLREHKCNNEGYAMGFAVPHNLKGNYFLEVKRASPFGEGGSRHREVQNAKCGVCNKNNE